MNASWKLLQPTRAGQRLLPYGITWKGFGMAKRTVALDGETYKRLRPHAAAEADQTRQVVLEVALAEYLNRANA